MRSERSGFSMLLGLAAFAMASFVPPQLGPGVARTATATASKASRTTQGAYTYTRAATADEIGILAWWRRHPCTRRSHPGYDGWTNRRYQRAARKRRVMQAHRARTKRARG